MIQRSWLLSGYLLLTACSSTPVMDQSSENYVLPVGSILELHQSINFQPHRARVFIQYGSLVHEQLIARYYPYCEFEINTLSNDVQTIRPDRFEVYKVNDDDYQVNRYMMYASLSIADDGGPSILGFATEFYIRSTKQPQVRKLACLHWDDPVDSRYLKLSEIQKALGNIFTIHPAQ